MTLALDCPIVMLFIVTFMTDDSGKPLMKLKLGALVAVTFWMVMSCTNGVVGVIGCGGSVQQAGGCSPDSSC